MFARTSGVGRLVGVAWVCWLVVHVWGQRRAEFACHSCPQAATLFPDHTQLAFAAADGLGGKSQRKTQQVHFIPEGIYLGRLEKGGRTGAEAQVRRVLEAVSLQKKQKGQRPSEWENGGEVKNEEREERKRIICHVRQVKWSQKGQIPRSSNKKRDGIVKMLAPWAMLEVCVLDGT